MKVVDLDGNMVGKVEVIYLDDETDEPEFALVDTGMFSGRSSFVPLAQAQTADDAIRVPYSKDQVKDAPHLEARQKLSQAEEAELYRYYGLDYSQVRSESDDEHRLIEAVAVRKSRSSVLTGASTAADVPDVDNPTKRADSPTERIGGPEPGTTEPEEWRIGPFRVDEDHTVSLDFAPWMDKWVLRRRASEKRLKTP